MPDYKEAIQHEHDYLCEAFYDKNGRQPTHEESLVLWDEAKNLADSRASEYADYLRKVSRGE